MRYTAVFQPQAWQSDYAVNVDAEGPREWDVTDDLLALSADDRARQMEADTYDSDTLRDLPQAPQWVKDWSGPFYVSVREDDNACSPSGS